MKLKGTDLLKYFFLTGLFILPFFYWPSAPIPFEIPKINLVNRWIEILVIVGIITNLKSIQKEKLDGLLIILSIGFLMAASISSYLGVNFQKSLLGNYYRGDGLITLSHLVGLFLTVVVFVKKEWIKDIAVSISLGSFLLSLWTVIDSFKLYVLHIYSVPNWDGAIGVSFGNPNFLAGYLVVTLPFIYYLSTSIKPKIHIYFTLAIQLAALFLTKTEAGILGILVFITLIVIFSKTKLRKLLLLMIFISFLIGTLATITKIKGQRYDQLFSAEGRERIIRKGLMAYAKRPIFGWGWANFDYAFDSVIWPVKLDHDVYVDKAHSHFLEILVTTGIIGFTIYFAILGKSFRNLIKVKKLRVPFLFTLILFVIHSQTNIISISEEVIFWIILGFSGKKA